MTTGQTQWGPMTKPTETVPLVSIIVPVFNGEKYLKQCLDSLLAQSYPNYELLVMDDASTDGTPGIVASYGDRLTVVRQARNRGGYANMNDGIALARGECIAIYHADDVYASDIVEREVAFLREHLGAGAVFCLDVFIDAEGREYGALDVPAELRTDTPLPYHVVLNALLEHKNSFLVTPSAMVRASVYRDVGPFRDDEWGIASDLDMWIRIAQKYHLGILHEYLMHYRHGHGNWTQQHYHLRTEPERHFRILDAQVAQDRALVTPRALAAHEAHRAEDLTMLAVNHYILGLRQEMGVLLRRITLRRLLGSDRVERGRLLALCIGLRVLARLPRIPFVAEMFYRRWHTKSYRAKG